LWRLAMKQPALFIGHGNPMNALADNSFTQALRDLGKRWPRPRAILCISAHWLTDGLQVTGMKKPRTIHDFYGFPKELFQVQYAAPGDPALAEKIVKALPELKIKVDTVEWGLDHGTWSVLHHLFPAADIPVLQLSIDIGKPAEFHYEVGKKLRFLRDEGVLILGSGDLVHNLRLASFAPEAKPFPWAQEFEAECKKSILAGDIDFFVEYQAQGEAAALSIPTPDHYYPFLTILGAWDPLKEKAKIEYEEIELSSISLLSASFGFMV
jgi:4,5-DOPA dioxygenase extradiol